MSEAGDRRVLRSPWPARRTALAVDVGGTKIAAAVVGDDGAILSRAELPTPATGRAAGAGGADVVGDALLRAASTAIAEAGSAPNAIGVGSAGPLDLDAGTVSPVNIPAWRGYPIVAVLGRAFPQAEVRLAGDGHCMALGEYWRRAHPMRTVLGMVVSTGVGGGVVADGRVQTGPTGNAGHIGHMVVDSRGPACPCGGRGCVEAFASGPSMVRWAKENGWDGTDAAALAASARLGDPVAAGAFARAADAIAQAVVCTAALVDLDDVVLGGGVVNGAADLLLDPIRERVTDLAGLAFIRRVRIGASRLGADAGLLGAAALGFAGGVVGADRVPVG